MRSWIPSNVLSVCLGREITLARAFGDYGRRCLLCRLLCIPFSLRFGFLNGVQWRCTMSITFLSAPCFLSAPAILPEC
ncbi:hypothetical protein XAC3607_4140008 [Xanthomonas citri pv. citri]|nr:hypothetical protein XAC3607_4140008 [Xanthomonas citri pv. citri]